MFWFQILTYIITKTPKYPSHLFVDFTHVFIPKALHTYKMNCDWFTQFATLSRVIACRISEKCLTGGKEDEIYFASLRLQIYIIFINYAWNDYSQLTVSWLKPVFERGSFVAYILPHLGNSFPCQKNNKDGDRLGHLLLSGKYIFKVRSVCDLIITLTI